MQLISFGSLVREPHECPLFFYHFENIHTGKKVTFDIRPFLKQFAALNAPQLKKQIQHQDEYLYLTHQFTNVFMLLQTKQHEIIRKVNTENLSIDEVNELLQKGEHFGFASYLILESDHFGICSTLMAPRFEALTVMLEKLFELIGVNDWKFVPSAVMSQLAPNKVKTLNHVGRTTVRVKGDLKVAEHFKNFLGDDVDDFQHIEELEITIKPKKNRDISGVAQRVVDKADDNEISRMKMRARESANSAMLDVYLVESGIISDQIGRRSAKEVTAVMQEKMSANSRLKGLVKENRNADNKEPVNISAISRFHTPAAWNPFIDRL